jgi:surfactin synthase thioesterase subunit
VVKKINLFCLPYGGGNKYCYRQYEACAQQGLQLVTLEYPGRASRSQEPPITDAYALADDLYAQLLALADGKPYALYGHSLGGLMVHLLAQKIMANGELPPPLHLFVTGTVGPSARKGRLLKRHLMPRDAFLEEVRRMDGVTDETLREPELLDYIEPMLRADFQVSDTYVYRAGEPYDLPLTVITGTKEPIETADIKAWELETRQPAVFRQMPGKHFFIFAYPCEIMATIARTIQMGKGLLL